MNKNLAKYFVALSLSLVSIMTMNVHAEGGIGGSPAPRGGIGEATPLTVQAKIENPFKCGGAGNDCNLFQFFSAIVENILLPIAGVLAVVAFIWSGFMFVKAQGDPAQIKTAKAALLYTAIGTAILLGAVAITKVISGTISALQSTP